MAKTPQPKNHEITEQFLQDERYKKNLLYSQSFDQFYLYDKGYYKAINTHNFRIIVRQFLLEQFSEMNIRVALLKDIVDQIKLGAYRQLDDTNTPYIAFNDKLYNMDTFELEDFDRAKIALHKMDIDSKDLGMPTPEWDNFLKTTLVKEDTNKTDTELVELTQEMFGYYLLNDLRVQQVFFLVGQGANGKSVMINVLQEMIGDGFVSAMSIQTLTVNQFATSSLIGKKVNICNEEESKYLKSDRFKALVSGDLIDADRKYGEYRIVFRPTTKYLFASNNMPTFDGINYGIKRRITIMPFNRIFSDTEQDRNMTKKLLKELPGVVQWSINGVKKLAKQNYRFTKPEATKKTEKEFEEHTSSAIMWFRKSFVIDQSRDPNNFKSHEVLYKEYVEWCQGNGKKAMSSPVMLKDLRQTIEHDTVVQYDSFAQKPLRGKYVIRFEEKVSEGHSMEEIEEAIANKTIDQI